MILSRLPKTAIITLLLFVSMLLSCQTSCADDEAGVKDQRVKLNIGDRVLTTVDLKDEDFTNITKIIYHYLKTGELKETEIPDKARRQTQALRILITISRNNKKGEKYFYDLAETKLKPINEKNKIKVPIFDLLKLRVDYVLDETSMDLNLNNDFNFIIDNFGLKVSNKEFVSYFLPEELISESLIDEKSKKLDLKDFIKYMKTQKINPSDVQSINDLSSYSFTRCNISSFYYDGVSEIKLLKGFRLFTEVNYDNLEYAYTIAGDYLKKMVRSDGRFAYVYHPGRDLVSKTYNILRHCGTIYSMMEVYELTKDKEILESAKRAIKYAVSLIKDYTDDSVCIVEDDVLKLGGNGLAAIALSKYIELTGDEEHLELLKKIGRWFQVIQEENGKFKLHKQIYSTREIIDDLCDYYPGEALLGIMRIYALTKDESLVQTAVKGAQYIVNIRDKDTSFEDTIHDHWLLYALNEINKQEPHPEFITKSQRIVKAMLLKMNKNPMFPEIMGSYYSNPRSTPTATRSEGILAAYRLFKDNNLEEDAKEALKAVGMSISYQLRTQFRPENLFYFADPLKALGGFQRGPLDYSIRIDYVQHNISSIVNYYKILKGMK